MTGDDLPFQPSSLQKQGEKKKKHTLKLVKRAIYERDKEQKGIPEELRQFETRDIIRILQKLTGDGKRIHKSTLKLNMEVAAAIAAARREDFQAIPDFSQYANAKINRKFDSKAQSRRLTYLLKKKSRDQLAQDVIGLTELDRHYTNRRKLLEAGRLDEGPWPANLPYPNDPFLPGLAAGHQYQQLRSHGRKAVLAKTIVTLEKRIAEHRQHIQKLDRLYMAQKPKHKPHERKPRGAKGGDPR